MRRIPTIILLICACLALVSTPIRAATDDEQSFVEASVAGDPVPNQFLSAVRARPFDHVRVYRSSIAVEHSVMHDAPSQRSREIAAGLFSAQLAYNAAVFRDPAAAASFLRALAALRDLDRVLPEFGRLRVTVTSVGSNDWSKQFALGNALTAAIVANGDETPQRDETP